MCEKLSAQIGPEQLRGDAPLAPDADDAIGLREVAARVAEALANLRSSSSLVIGLEGRWGSGKSSLLSEIEQALSRAETAKQRSLVHFRPWLVGNRDALLGQLFGDLERAVAGVQAARGDSTRKTIQQARRASKALRGFATAVERTGTTVELAGDLSALAPVKWVGKGLATLGGWLGKEPKAKSLDVLREQLVEALEGLGHTIIVTIDDIDRLEPIEMLEVLRLVRSVGNLPGVIYLLCYDSTILAHGVKQAADVDDGHAYLEKIIQLTVPVPQPETFKLRHWFEFCLADFAVAHDDESARRLKTIVDTEGGRRFTTPRSVVRALDALRFLWPTLKKAGADLPDLVWLQLIKDGDPSLYRWIERYCAIASELALGTAQIDEEERGAMLAELVALSGDRGFGSLHQRHYFAEQLPGVELNYTKEGPPFTLFARVDERERNLAIAGRRLASPDHYRLYFALTGPDHALKQADFDEFFSAAGAGGDAFSRLLVCIQARPSQRTLSQVDVMLERIRGRDLSELPPVHCANILVGFSNALDDLYRVRPFERFWVTGPWDRAERLIKPLLSQLDVDLRATTVDSMFEGLALSWLTNVFRRETFAHGRAGNRPKSDDERYFTELELNRISAVMIRRYREMTLDDILNQISPVDILFAWVQGGDEAEIERVQAVIRDQCADDARFMRLLDALRSTITTSEGRYKALKPDGVGPFLSFDTIESRLKTLAAQEARPELAKHAKELLAAIATGEAF